MDKMYFGWRFGALMLSVLDRPRSIMPAARST
jgi:hypothetical protein